MDRTNAILARLRDRGGRITLARRAIVEAMVSAGDHVSADDLAAAVAVAHPDVHRSTVYRNLDALEHAGIVEHVHLGHGRAVYHLAGEPHVHLVCDSCGAVVEVPEQRVRAFRDQVRKDHGFRLDAHHFSIGGICRGCAGR